MNENQISEMMGRLVSNQRFFSELSKEDCQWIVQNPKEAINFFSKKLEEERNRPQPIITEKPIVIPFCEYGKNIVDIDFQYPPFDRISTSKSMDSLRGDDGSYIYEKEIQAFDVRHSDYETMFRQFSEPFRDLCLKQVQIGELIRKHWKWMTDRDNPLIYFLIEDDSNYYVVRFYFDYEKYSANISAYPLGDRERLGGHEKCRIITPKIM